MSTILNTLKKLEEEKSVRENNIDLKGLLLQRQETVYPQVADRGSRRKWGTVGGLITGVVLLAGLMAYLAKAPKTGLSETQPAFTRQPVSPAPAQKKPQRPLKTNPGFPLSGIRDIAPATMTDPLYDDDFFEPENTLVLPVEISPSVMDEALPEGAKEIREIESLIQSAIESSERRADRVDEIPLIALNSTLTIPGLTVKGIIFLNPGNPINHIFVSTPNAKNRKLKVGETLLSATLEDIEPQKAIFSYQSQRVEKTIGE